MSRNAGYVSQDAKLTCNLFGSEEGSDAKVHRCYESEDSVNMVLDECVPSIAWHGRLRKDRR